MPFLIPKKMDIDNTIKNDISYGLINWLKSKVMRLKHHISFLSNIGSIVRLPTKAINIARAVNIPK